MCKKKLLNTYEYFNKACKFLVFYGGFTTVHELYNINLNNNLTIKPYYIVPVYDAINIIELRETV